MEEAYRDNQRASSAFINRSTPEILKRSDHVILRSTQVDFESDVNYSFDLDGFEIWTSSAASIGLSYHFLKWNTSMINMNKVMKKLDNKQDMSHFVGLSLGYESGVQLFFVSNNAAAVHMFRKTMSNMLEKIQDRDRLCVTAQTNVPGDFLKVNTADWHIVSAWLDVAAAKAKNESNCEVGFFLRKHGQKSESFEELHILKSFDDVILSVHVALELAPIEENMHLLWSRCGLEEIVGAHGMMFPALSMAECANYRSNLDRRDLSISQDVKNCVIGPSERITFVQFYATSPHHHVQSRNPGTKRILMSHALNEKVSISYRLTLDK